MIPFSGRFRLSGHERKFGDVCCAQFGLGRGARCFRTGTRASPGSGAVTDEQRSPRPNSAPHGDSRRRLPLNTAWALDGVGKPGAAGGTSDVRRSGRTERIQERLLGIPADFKWRRLSNRRNSARPAITATNPAAHKTKRSECCWSSVWTCGAQDSCACAAHSQANTPAKRK